MHWSYCSLALSDRRSLCTFMANWHCNVTVFAFILFGDQQHNPALLLHCTSLHSVPMYVLVPQYCSTSHMNVYIITRVIRLMQQSNQWFIFILPLVAVFLTSISELMTQFPDLKQPLVPQSMLLTEILGVSCILGSSHSLQQHHQVPQQASVALQLGSQGEVVSDYNIYSINTTGKLHFHSLQMWCQGLMFTCSISVVYFGSSTDNISA